MCTFNEEWQNCLDSEHKNCNNKICFYVNKLMSKKDDRAIIENEIENLPEEQISAIYKKRVDIYENNLVKINTNIINITNSGNYSGFSNKEVSALLEFRDDIRKEYLLFKERHKQYL